LSFESGNAANREHINGAQELGKLCEASLIELMVRPACQSGDFLEALLGMKIRPFLKHESRDAELGELGGPFSELITSFFASVADKDEGIDFALQRFS
jgi:hypothetical protein